MTDFHSWHHTHWYLVKQAEGESRRWTENITYDLEQKGDSARRSVSRGIVASSNDAAYCPVSQSEL